VETSDVESIIRLDELHRDPSVCEQETVAEMLEFDGSARGLEELGDGRACGVS
jgi:hypothetical protein